MPWLSVWEIAMILVVALVVLGPKRLPRIAKMLGKSLRGLQRMSSDLRSAVAEPLDEVREPLKQMREDLYETATHFEQQIREEVQGEEPIPRPVARDDEDDPEGDRPASPEAPVVPASAPAPVEAQPELESPKKGADENG